MLGDDIINHILKNIDEYTNNVNIQVKNEIIETSIPSISNKDINEVLIFYIHLLMLTMFIFQDKKSKNVNVKETSDIKEDDKADDTKKQTLIVII